MNLENARSLEDFLIYNYKKKSSTLDNSVILTYIFLLFILFSPI
jgi:hypothetical protein